ncbi:unnamed protein product [Auanema sp. JU1783]|nr:unnamed protein product [Auanema sp. JU1783]
MEEVVNENSPSLKMEELRDLKRRALVCLSSIADSAPTPTKREKREHADRELYCSLIKTFDNKAWKHSDLCAKDLVSHGWRNNNGKTVKCDSCQKVICTDLPSISENVDVYKKCVSDINRRIVESHQLTCPRRSSSIKISKFENLIDLKADMIKRLKSNDDDLQLKIDFAMEVPTQSFSSYPRERVICSLLNWGITKQVVSPNKCRLQFACDLCNRCTSLSENESFDPVLNHMKWCPLFDKDNNGMAMWRSHLSLLTQEKTVRITSEATSMIVGKVKSLLRKSISTVALEECN